jgi:NAD-dependent SIR2 family protein deacetylase
MHPRVCGCARCEQRIDFEFDDHLLEEIEQGNCVIFAGSGISTETEFAHCNTFYEEIAHELHVGEEVHFPALMSMYQSQPNGRQKLIQKILARFRYIDSWRPLRLAATEFHQELSTMPYFSQIVTTNWDRYFEDICAATPFVYDSDIAFWDLAGRSVLKIHGSIDNFSSLVATQEDYANCAERLRNGSMGAVLKQMFATKTCLFIGYSAKDSDFLQIFDALQESLGPFRRTHYMVAPMGIVEDRLSDRVIKVINTTGSFFLEVVKEHMCEKFAFARDATFAAAAEALSVIIDEHLSFTESFSLREEPHLLCATMYQDGLIHALERIVDQKRTGEYSDLHRARHQVHLYKSKIDEYTKQRDYREVSYFSGYLTGLIYFLLLNEDDTEEGMLPPPYFHPGFGEMSPEEFEEKVRFIPDVHKGALAQSKRIIGKMPGGDDIVLQHTPFG